MMPHFDDRDGVFFDFDGVLVDSLNVKTRAFARLYDDHGPAVVDKVMAYHLANGGVSRFKKFEHYERTLLGRELAPQRIEELGQRFASLVVEEVVASDAIGGSLALLERLSARRTPCYVVSGTPEDELRVIVERRGMSHFFRDVRGSPAEKGDLLQALCARAGHRPQHCIMVGDALGDYTAARAAGMGFLGVVSAGLASPFPPGTQTVRSFENDFEPAG